jgi:GDP/UDP-N,N'-diacetylbacillosamine 2-epimerase (hydrolysing)
LGDRFEIFAAVTAALICRIPVAHIGGGDSSEGAIDESMRNSITKMSHLHFTMLESHRRRLIQLGEDPERIFNVGSLSIDNIKNTNLLKKNELENALSFKLGKKNLLVTFHPCTLENSTAESQFKNLLSVLSEMPDVRVIFTKPNADTEGRVIIDLINNYVARHKNNCICVDSLGARVYLSALQFVDAVVGNSSSGIVEAPSFKIASINIGDRQRGRARAGSIIDCQPTRASLGQAFNKVYSPGFRRGLSEVKNPYDKGSAAKAIKGILKKHNLEGILKKKFFELWVNSNEQGRNRN